MRAHPFPASTPQRISSLTCSHFLSLQASKIFHVACACLDVVQCILPCENQEVHDPMRTLELLKGTLARLGRRASGLYIEHLESKVMIAGMLP